MTRSEHGQGDDLVVVFRAPDQYTANVVKGLLASEDIPVVLESRQVAWLDGVMAMGEGFWGNVVVPAQYEQRSRSIIDAYEAQMELQEN